LFKPVYEQRSGYLPYSDSATHAFETALWLKPNFSYVNHQVGHYWVFVWKKLGRDTEERAAVLLKRALELAPDRWNDILETALKYEKSPAFLEKVVPETEFFKKLFAQFLASKGLVKG
ncbi:MAG: hypothetical protein HY731_08105, partial [Candidatus Tectomicrobia bacterium]|nr:hypothetical protein [Candidatus Tectomicrobia bacterium]